MYFYTVVNVQIPLKFVSFSLCFRHVVILIVLKDCIPALIDFAKCASAPESVQVSSLQALTNLSVTSSYHPPYTKLIQHLYECLDNGSKNIQLHALKVLVNLSSNPEMVPHLLAAKVWGIFKFSFWFCQTLYPLLMRIVCKYVHIIVNLSRNFVSVPPKWKYFTLLVSPYLSIMVTGLATVEVTPPGLWDAITMGFKSLVENPSLSWSVFFCRHPVPCCQPLSRAQMRTSCCGGWPSSPTSCGHPVTRVWRVPHCQPSIRLPPQRQCGRLCMDITTQFTYGAKSSYWVNTNMNLYDIMLQGYTAASRDRFL